MKYIVLLGDGMADYPLPKLGVRTPLEYAKTPNMDWIAREGTVGLINTIPAGFPPGSDVANLSVLGYDPERCYTGRGPLEAASMGIKLDPEDVAFRCNLVTLGGEGGQVMDDYAAGQISSAEAEEMIVALNRELGSDKLRFYRGVSYRHLLVWKAGPVHVETTPPHDITGRRVDRYLPRGEGAERIIEVMRRSQSVLEGHPVNQVRRSQGKKVASSIWLWGQGTAPEITPITKKYGLRGAMISAVDLLKGIGIYAGLDIIQVGGATGYIDTNYRGKAEKALEVLRDRDLVFVHVEAPDEMGHEGDAEGKIRAIEEFDEKVVGPILMGMRNNGLFRIMVLSDHPTPISLKTHANDPSPFVVYSAEGFNLRNGGSFCERVAQKTGFLVIPGYRLMENFIGDWKGFIEREGH